MFKEEPKKGGSQDTVVAQGVKVQGDFISHGNIIVEGEVHGTIKIERDLHVGEQALIQANIKAQNAIVAGEIKGNMKISERLELSPTSRVTGDVQAKTISIAPGAILNGKCSMPGGPESVMETLPEKKRSRVKPMSIVEIEEEAQVS